MKIVINVKPVVITAPTKLDVINKAVAGKKSQYSGLPTWQQDSVILMNFHKVRRKVIQSRPKNGKKTKSTVITPAHWVAYVYTFNLSVLKASGVKKITQNSRNFSLSF